MRPLLPVNIVVSIVVPSVMSQMYYRSIDHTFVCSKLSLRGSARDHHSVADSYLCILVPA